MPIPAGTIIKIGNVPVAASTFTFVGAGGITLTGNPATGTITFSGGGGGPALPLSISNGGTNADGSSYTPNGVFYYTGTQLATTPAGIAGQVLVSQGPDNPPMFQHAGAANIGISGNTGSATSGSFSIVGPASGPISTSMVGTTLTINYIPSWFNVTSPTYSLLSGSGYVANYSGLVTFSLPIGAPFGSVIQIIGGLGSGGWEISLSSGQTIILGADQTTTSLSSSQVNDAIALVATTSPTGDVWAATSCIGNLTGFP